MENVYTEENIRDIQDHIKKVGYADNYAEPTFYLITTLTFESNILYCIHTSPNFSPFLITLLSLFMLRLFMIFHDMCHRSFFPTDERTKKYKGLNFKVAGWIEQWCVYPAERWNSLHSMHHKAHGNMNVYDGTRTVLTSDKYNSLGAYTKKAYRIGRSPFLFFPIAPLKIYFLSHVLSREYGLIFKYSVWMFFLFRVGSTKLTLSYLLAQYLAGVIGLMLFHLQHQVNVGYWKLFEKDDRVSKFNAELQGASVLKIPSFLEYFSNGIEYHNVHHMDAGVPCYKTKQVYYELVQKGLIKDTKIGYWQQFTSLGHTIFNTETNLYE